jgi:predicted O-linked N-acetylglucosamine transferase (SPINDLY family)
VGFVSADFSHHPVAYFMLPLFRAHDRTAFSIHCFAQSTHADHMTADFKQLADSWDEIAGLDDRTAAHLIRDRSIDVLFDMAGHTLNNRLGVFALKPAPVQISWAGYVGTTGLSAMDYVLADRHQAPPEDGPAYVEKIVRMPHSYVPYAPPAYAPDVAPAPLRANGHITFGAFHNPAKINQPVLLAWAEILRGVPDARLILKFRGLDAEANQRRVKAIMGSAGVAESRLTFAGFSPHREFLATYGQVDIALDPFPYSGGVTTCEALWMGVPVVTLRGATFAGRHAAGYLATVGLADLIAENRDAYIKTAIGLAADPARIEGLRTTMRSRLSQSPLLDYDGFARDFATVLRQVWRDTCDAAQRSV